ncbi:adenylate kinase [Dactylosporangium sp. CS-047395]|uniref:adenylate kinase n=1 Tax=Dactylosporangium sp. CS-047395 TaxID=3239936 RepID=UPI003D8A2135
MRLLLIAPPGAGKGTQAARIAGHFGVPHITTGELLRDHVRRDTPLGKAVRASMDAGALVPDPIVRDMVGEAMADAKAAGIGYVLDGYPRTRPQARAAHRIAAELGMPAHAVLHLRVDDEEAVRRTLARAVAEHRADDTERVIRRRLKLYHEVTQPVVDGYAARGILISVDGTGTPDEVTARVIERLERGQDQIGVTPVRGFPPESPAREHVPDGGQPEHTLATRNCGQRRRSRAGSVAPR